MGGLAQQMSGHVLCKSDRSFNSCNSYFGYEIRGHGYGAIIKEALQEEKIARVLILREAVWNEIMCLRGNQNIRIMKISQILL